MGAEREPPIVWDGVVVKIHPSHAMVDVPEQMGTECRGCGSCTCHGIPELTQPCSYVFDYIPTRPEPAPQARWDRVVASVIPSHWFDDQLMFEIVYRDVRGNAYAQVAFVEKDDLERYPSKFGETFEAMIEQLETALPPF